MKILITGIHGFVGSNIVKAMGRNHEIYGLDIVAPEKESVVKTFSWKDLDENKIPQIDAVIHLAGKAHDLKKTSGPEVYFKINTGLTQKIYDWFLQSSAGKFIFFSSVKAAADFVPGDILTEDIVPNPVGPYGESKIKAEEYILSHPATGKQVYILRPCMIHGPGNKGNLNLLYGVVKKGIPWPLGAFENRRCFTSIGNLCFAIKGLLTKDVASGIYNMGDDESLSTNELIAVICSALGKRAHIWHLPKELMNGMAKVGDVLHLPLNSERLTKLTENYVVSNAKIKRALGVDRMPIRAEEGLTQTVKSFANTK
ncbi:NAD-dependent epimerase/dehydratase family protein [Bacteroides xylanisolvens]|uniref:NAD-dependent epimerase/dehydratase family protein n=1 Tax=Bacteroides xylanisolvens TaxID=371601 RepID=UPI00189E37D2|nr:NAD-dependent epimerase/dehydratase family protein [Bacteroides xylanisolvens]